MRFKQRRMRRRKKKESPPMLLILMGLIGFFQMLYIYGSFENPLSKEDVPEHSMMLSKDRKYDMANTYIRQNDTEFGNKDNMMQSVTMATTEHKVDTIDALPPIGYSIRQFIPPMHDPLLYGQLRSRKGFLTIGIPSIRRPNTENIYLYKTIESLINNTSEEEKRDITLVILLSDLNETYNNEISKDIFVKFRIYFQGGFIRIIQAPKTIYPNFEQLKLTLHDPVHRVHWRSKQNIDFGYLFLYCKNISDYYLQLEDDVLSAQNYSVYIRKQIRHVNNTKQWFMLEFSRLGFIGKLFKDRDLQWVGNYLLKNFAKAPGDLFLGKMRALHGQKSPIHTEFSLFQHNGKFSSLKNKMMPSIDSKFKDADKIKLPIMTLPKGDNPPAIFETSFESVPGYPPYYAYDNNSSTFYWAKRPQKLDYFTLHFEKPHNFSRIIISTGDAKRKQDSLAQSTLSVSVKQTTVAYIPGKCGNFITMAEFIDGEIDTKAMGLHIPNNILCLKILLKRNSKTWVIIRDIVLIHV